MAANDGSLLNYLNISNYRFSTYKTSINVVIMLMINPTIVIKFGANHRGTFDTKKHHQGCKIGSRILTFVQAYLCSDSLFNCTPDNNLFLYRNIFRICDISVTKLRLSFKYLKLWFMSTTDNFGSRWKRKYVLINSQNFNVFWHLNVVWCVRCVSRWTANDGWQKKVCLMSTFDVRRKRLS